MAKFSFEVFDPRPISAAQSTNEAIFASGPVLGIEVTIPALAERCELGNLDPQHTGGNADLAAIEVAQTAELPADGAVLATVRADLDSVGAMAVLALRADGVDLAPATERINQVAVSDKFARGGWPGPRELPSRENPWPVNAAASESRPLAAIAAAVADFKVSLAERVETMKSWLLTGQEPSVYGPRVEAERLAMIGALETGQIKARISSLDPRVAVVVSTHRAATTVGYALAPVVVALNPEFRFRDQAPVRKFTVCQFEAGHCDLRGALAELKELEPGWGGSPTIGGSPQGQSSELELARVEAMVVRHLA